MDVDQYILERNRGLLLRSKSTSELASNRQRVDLDRHTMSTDRRRTKAKSQLELSIEEEDIPPILKPKTISTEYGKVLRKI